jgi:serine/threonine-protein kinase
VKVLDFGISKMLNEEQEAKHDPQAGKLTRVGSVVGTPQYMSPEQAQGLATVDHRTDLWSLGAIFYEMLAGQPAYDLLQTYEQTIVHIVVNPPPPLHVRAPWVPHTLSQVVHECLEHNTASRVRDAATLLRRVREVATVPIRDYSGALPALDQSAPSLAGSRANAVPSTREVPPALGSGPTTLNFDLGSQPNIPLAAYGVQVSGRPQQATSSAPVALEQTAPSVTEDRMPVIEIAELPRSRKRAGAVGVLLAALGFFGLVIGGLALKSTFENPKAVTATPARAAVVAPAVPEPREPELEAIAVDAGAPPAPTPKAAKPQITASPAPAPAWQPPPPKASKDRKLGDVGHSDEF